MPKICFVLNSSCCAGKLGRATSYRNSHPRNRQEDISLLIAGLEFSLVWLG